MPLVDSTPISGVYRAPKNSCNRSSSWFSGPSAPCTTSFGRSYSPCAPYTPWGGSFFNWCYPRPVIVPSPVVYNDGEAAASSCLLLALVGVLVLAELSTTYAPKIDKLDCYDNLRECATKANYWGQQCLRDERNFFCHPRTYWV